MAHTCIHGGPEQELKSKKMAAPSGGCSTGKATSLLLFLLSSCCFGRVAAVNFSALTPGGQQTDDDQHPSDWPPKKLHNLLRINGNDRHEHRFVGTGLTDQRRSLRRFRHNNPTRSYHGREHEGSAAAAAKGEANGDRRPTAHAAVADSGQRGDDIFVHSKDKQSLQTQTPRYPTGVGTGTGTGTGWEEQQRKEETGAFESPQLDLNKDGEENTRNEDRPNLATSTLIQDQRDEQEQEQMKIRQHLELSTCLSTLSPFAALIQDAPAAGQAARQPSTTTRPKHLITKQGILDLLSDAVSTAASSSERRSSEIPIAEMRWTDLPLPLIMQYNYASCSSPRPSYEGKDGVCTAAGEGVALETIVGGDPLQEEASIFDATRHKWPHRRYNNGSNEEQGRIGVLGERKSGQSVEWPLRMLCREVTNYAQELASAALIFAGSGDDASQNSMMSSDHLDVELHYSYVMSNVSYALSHSARNSRTGPFGSADGLVGRIRQRAMLKQKLAIATESVIRIFLGCSATKSMEEEDVMSLLEEDEVLRKTWVHRTHKINVMDADKPEGNNHKRRRRVMDLGANPGYRPTPSSMHETSKTHREENKETTTIDFGVNIGAASTRAQVGEEMRRFEVMGASDLESAVFGGCDFVISAKVEKLQKISCKDQYCYGCALVESSVYVRVHQGSGITNFPFSDDANGMRIEILRAIKESIHNGLFQQLAGIQ